MQVTETVTDNLKREYKVVISAKDLGDKLEARLEKVGQQVRVPGFRPGKVPMPILKKRFTQSVMGEVVEQAVRDSSAQAMNERGLRPAMQPKIEITSFDEGQDLEYKIALELLPEFEVGDLSQIELERVKVVVPDAEVAEALQRLAQARRETRPLETARPAAKDDVLVIDFRGTVDGEEFPGMSGEGHHLELGGNRFVEGFEEQLIGAEVGQSRTVEVRFPETYVNDKLAGREAVFDVPINEIRESVPRPIDDALAKELGADDLETLRGTVRQQIESDYKRLERAQVKRKLLDKLAEAHDFAVPEGMVNSEFEAIWTQIEEERSRGRSDPDDEGKSDDQLKAEYREIADRRVRLGLLLSEIGRLNGIEVSQEEVNRAIAAEARQHPGQERQIFDFYQSQPEALSNLRAPIYENKVVDFILDLAQVTEREVSPADLLAKEAEKLADDSGAMAESEGPAKPAESSTMAETEAK